jgi:hypothetical protein
MRKALLLIVAAAIGLVLVAIAGAHNFTASPQLRIAKVPAGATAPGARIFVFGRIVSSQPFCKSNRKVRLFRMRPGRDAVIGTDLTDREGEYRFVRQPRRDQTVYTVIVRRVHTSYGHSHICRADRSGNLRINVR